MASAGSRSIIMPDSDAANAAVISVDCSECIHDVCWIGSLMVALCERTIDAPGQGAGGRHDPRAEGGRFWNN
eukprot:scaffold5043_cov115-Isochrysis_galbana.AAC.4